MYTFTNAKKLVKICLVIAEVFDGICRFLPFRPKRCCSYSSNLCGYWTDLDQTDTQCVNKMNE